MKLVTIDLRPLLKVLSISFEKKKRSYHYVAKLIPLINNAVHVFLFSLLPTFLPIYLSYYLRLHSFHFILIVQADISSISLVVLSPQHFLLYKLIRDKIKKGQLGTKKFHTR